MAHSKFLDHSEIVLVNDMIGIEESVTTSKPAQVYRYQSNKKDKHDTETVIEAPVSITVNGTVWLTFMCTPVQLEALAVGFLFNEGVIQGIDEIATVHVCEHSDNVDVWLTHAAAQPQNWKRTSGCTGGVTSVEGFFGLAQTVPLDNFILSPEQVTKLADLLLGAQKLYKETGGVHTSALSDGKKIILSTEDIGRHNTLDKIAGRCLLENIWLEHRVLLTTGRISSEMMQKAMRLGAVVVISRTAPSSLSIEMAERYGITLIGYARQHRFNVYSNPQGVMMVEN